MSFTQEGAGFKPTPLFFDLPPAIPQAYKCSDLLGKLAYLKVEQLPFES